MQATLEINSAIEVIRTAFMPLGCSLESYDFDRKLRFRVFNKENENVLNCPELRIDLATNPDRLSWAINQARNNVLKQNIFLDFWIFPLEKI